MRQARAKKGCKTLAMHARLQIPCYLQERSGGSHCEPCVQGMKRP